MPGLEPGIQALRFVIIMDLSALDARVKPVQDGKCSVCSYASA